jgi:hypothetical protein
MGSGWRKIHVRSRCDPPIAALLTRGDLERAFGGDIQFRGVSYHGAPSPIASGFSYWGGGVDLYGIEEDRRIVVLGIGQLLMESRPESAQSLQRLAKLARDFDLELVNWCRCARASWDSPLFRRLLLGDP